MSFDNEIQEIFDIDVWLIKPAFVEKDENELESDKPELQESQPQDIKTEVVDELVNEAKAVESKLIYSTENESSKVINIFIAEEKNLNFIKNICKKLFYNSSTNIYIGKYHIKDDNININFRDCLLEDKEILSITNKKHILEKLYQYADFTTK
ncbi:hypothetical protein [Francisella adeliensis]|uniref:Uncharacterized protein n=1 Tax=Francisella adeliensis TaxID=2007306 RepID=A0A2Z4XYK6_9GAMM|nr:hypothetical protein [Francisella adeliensis]AXA33869.1 hypothetical protein CDH04_05300 [Francisella adeliensis]MBK2085771.1 hypothetical protein [Francisella adeliensis]MBK2097649.1 hypothetical protein [Francisella adeliensis]QIW12106.1 hypothetical protein FZC43_05305 [Francisella adeliensis]QIW13980.1 hypothetical protein FZC44_05305 [Francisella adeliensis]